MNTQKSRQAMPRSLVLSFGSSSMLKKAALCLMASASIALSAQITVPLYPVPMTLQSFWLMVLAIYMGPKLATISTILYLLEGAAGLPVFAQGKLGLITLLGPTGGYLLSFPLAVWVVGTLYNKAASIPGLLRGALASMLGHVFILSLGTLFLAKFIGLEKAWTLGALPFLPFAVLKSAFVGLVANGKKLVS